MDKESQDIEFKESWRDEYLKWICGFANATGGTLYIGINDSGEVCGLHDTKKLMEDIPNKVRDLLGILVNVNIKKKDDKEYIEIEVDSYPYPISYRSHYYQRSGATNQELKGASLDCFMLRKQGRTWDSVPVPFFKKEHLDNTAFELFRKYAKRSGRMDNDDLNGDNEELLDKLRLIEGEYYKRSTALLFADDPEKFVTGSYIKIAYFKEGAHLIFQDEVHGNLFKQVKSAIDLITTKYMRALVSYEGIQRVETLPVPREALREALLNAIVHKAYETFTPIQIAVYDDKLEIWNSGVLPENWTISNFLSKHRSCPYNPEIANVFFRAGEIEAWGRGIERIMAACKEAGMPEPQFNYDGTGVWTIFPYAKNSETTRKQPENNQKLSGIQEKILEYLKRNPTASRKEITQNIENATEGSIRHHLEHLKELGYIVREGADKGGSWKVLK